MKIRLNKEAIGDGFKDNDLVSYSGRFHYCESCHTEFYYLWELDMHLDGRISTNDLASIEYIKVHNNGKCPICGDKLKKEPGYFCSCDTFRSLNFEGDYIDTAKYQGVRVSKFSSNVNKEKYRVHIENHLNGVKVLAFSGQDFKNTQVCKFNLDKYFDVNKIYEEMAEIRTLYQKDSCKQAFDSFKMSNDVKIPICKSKYADKIGSDPKKLSEYIDHLITLETEIHGMSKRLIDLYKLRSLIKNDIISERHVNKYRIINDNSEQSMSLPIKNTIAILQKELSDIKSAPLEIAERFVYPTEPPRPVLQTPGVFNKKRILEENQRAEEEYQIAYEKYMNRYKLIDDRRRESEFKAREEKDRKIYAIEQKLNEKTMELESVIEKENEIAKAIEKKAQEAMLFDVPSQSKLLFIEDEIAKAETTLAKCYQCKNKLYSYGIVFEKYQNIIALSAFSEYLMSGRVFTLSGPDGAYNLYENECRMNLIISQLSEVLEALEKIQENQYLLYSKLTEINNELVSLNNATAKAISALDTISDNTGVMSESLEAIKNNTEVIAYNTEVTAYYSKVNAELTNSLGYMVAFS